MKLLSELDKLKKATEKLISVPPPNETENNKSERLHSNTGVKVRK